MLLKVNQFCLALVYGACFTPSLGFASPISSAGDVVWLTDRVAPAQFQQPLTSRLDSDLGVPAPASVSSAPQLAGVGFGGVQSSTFGASFVTGPEATLRATTDTGDLLGSSPEIFSTGVQRRNPIVTDPRVRGSRVGSMAASGSYWVPARIDLDTAVSKIDSRIVEEVAVIPGPYSALFGPGFEFVDIQLAKAPRYGEQFETHGATSVDYRHNGEQVYGRQSISGGDNVWGFRAGYGHRTGNDYVSGNGTGIPSSYKSRDFDLALGAQLTPDSTIDLQGIRLDQTDIELAGQAFDIDWLVTDGYDVQFVRDAPGWADELSVETWYNRTRFEGSAQRSGKRRQFPYLDFINFVGATDVDSLSTGYSIASTWRGVADDELILGTDLRFVNQELNEITSGRRGFFQWTNVNSPIPRSYYANPGLFAQYQTDPSELSKLTTGARLDLAAMDVFDPNEIGLVGVQQVSAAAILGSDDFDQDELLGSTFVALDHELVDGWVAGTSVGYAERSPNITERYAIEPFMFLIQNGLNTVTGDPNLDKERRVQVDLRLQKQTERWRLGGNLFHAWVNDYITFEAMSAVAGPPGGIQQINLKYVNTDLATLWGAEAFGEYDWTDHLTPFATLRYVEGQDRSRNGSFATRQATANVDSAQVAGMNRGAFSTLGGGASEALPGILPLESRLGIRWHEAAADPWWGTELSVRMVAAQDRVATSLFESATPGFSVWDLRSYYRPRERLLMLAGVENFTDKQFREHLDFRSGSGQSVFRPGVTFYGGVEWTY